MSKIVKELISENKRLKHELSKAAVEFRELNKDYESVCSQFLKEIKKGLENKVKITISEEDLITDGYDKTAIRKYKESLLADYNLTDYIIEEEEQEEENEKESEEIEEEKEEESEDV